MKPQEFKFLVLNTKADWGRGCTKNLQISEEGLRLKSGSQFLPESTIARDELGHLQVIDFAVGEAAQLYLLDEKTQQLWRFDAPQKRLEPIKYIDALLSKPTNIALSQQTIFVADERQESRETTRTFIYAFARVNWQIRWILDLQHDVTLRDANVVDLAVDAEGNLYVLLDTGEKVVAKYAPSGERVEAARFTRGNIEQPSAIALGSDGAVYVLDAQQNWEKVVKFTKDGVVTNRRTVINFAALRDDWAVPEDIQPSGLAVDSEGNLYIGDSASAAAKADRKVLSKGEEESRFIFRFSPSQNDNEQAAPELVPGYRGAVTKLTVDGTGRLFIFNARERVVKVFKQQQGFFPRHQFEDEKSLPTGQFFSPVFDSTNPGQQWHKLVLDAEIPDNTQVQVSYLISDIERYEIDECEWLPLLPNPRDALFRGSGGRYLYLKVELIGTEQQTPTVKSIRVYFPRLSYLRYLPAVYQEDETSRDFLERFLSLFETFFANIEERIDHIDRYFDADAVDRDFLPWLSIWLAIAIDENWTEQQLRDLVKNVPQLYRQRGTREGIAATIELFTGDRPLIIEPFQLDQDIGSDAPKKVQEQFKQWYGDNPFRFWVLLNPLQVNSKLELQTIQRLVDADKPAHTEAGLKVLQPWIYLDGETYLGFNTCLLEPSVRLGMGAAISQHTILTDSEEFGQIETRSRLGLDTTVS